MRRLMKCGVSAAVVMTGAVLLSFAGTARADLAVTSTCAQVPLASEYDRAAAAAALPTFVGINQICVLQALLATVGALPGSRAVDGRYDRQTRDALKSFQVQNALVSNGLLTPETMNSLTEAALERMFDTTGAAEVTAAQAVPEAAPAAPAQSEEKSISDTLEALKLASPAAAPVLELAPTQNTIELPASTRTHQALTNAVQSSGGAADPAEAVEPSITSAASTPTLSSTDNGEGGTISRATSTVAVTTENTALTDDQIVDLVKEAARAGTLGQEPILVSQTTTTTTIVDNSPEPTTEVATEVVRDPLDNTTVSSFVAPSICHAPSSAKDQDLIRNRGMLPVGTCLRTFVGAGDLPYQIYSLEVLADGPTLVLLHDGDDASFDAAVATLNAFGGRLVVLQSEERTRTTILGGNPEIMTVSPSLNARCDWAQEERPLAFAVHDYVVAGSKPVIILRRNRTGQTGFDVFSDGKYRFDRTALGPARELFVSSGEPVTGQAFMELMVTSVTRRSLETRNIIRSGVQEGLPVALTLVDALGLRDQCSLESLALQTTLPVIRVLLGDDRNNQLEPIIAAAFNAVGFDRRDAVETLTAGEPVSDGSGDIPASVLALAAGGLDADLNDDLSTDGESTPRSLSEAIGPGLPPLPLDRPSEQEDPLVADAAERASSETNLGRITTGVSAGSGVDALSPVAIGGVDGVVVSTGGLEGVIVEEAVGPVSGALPPQPILRPISDALYRFIPDDIDPILAMDGGAYYLNSGSGLGAEGNGIDQPRVISSRTIQTTVPNNPFAVPASQQQPSAYTDLPTIYIQQQPANQGTGGVSGPLYGNGGESNYAPQPPSNETIIINNSIY